MHVLTWNIQWCRGVDGRVDPVRIARAAKSLCDPDIVCLQEVASNYPALGGSRGEDQATLLASQFPGYQAAFANGVDVDDGRGGRRRFGNLILSRYPIGRVLRHSLPWPADPGVATMPRSALEVVVTAPWGPLRVTTTHLEYYSLAQRTAQVAQLRALHAEACAHDRAGPAARRDDGPFHPWPRPASALLAGDFNLPAGDPLHARLGAPFDDGSPTLLDAWAQAHPGNPHPPTFHVHDTVRTVAAYCCDFVFLTADLVPRLEDVRVDGACQASDHQPVLLRFSG